MMNLPNISSRPMMGGWIIYSNKKPFALISDRELYLKSKTKIKDWEQFQYQKSGNKIVKLFYWKIPDDQFDDKEKFEEEIYAVMENLQIYK